ncbi:hypothetical protein [Palaeococcus sp. (in: euryarchaeotes)]
MNGGFVIIAVAIGIPVFMMALIWYIKWKNLKKVETISNGLKIVGDEIIFPVPLKIERGFLNLRASWRLGGRGFRYMVSKSFTPEESFEGERARIIPRPFRIILNEKGEGKVKLPGFRIKEGHFKNVLLLYTFPSYEFKFSKRSLRIIGDEDFAELIVEPGENCFKGYIQALEFRKAKRAKVEIIGANDERVERCILETKRIMEFSHTSLTEPLLIITHPMLLEPRKLLETMGIKKAVDGHGSFKLRFCIELGIKRELKDEADFKVDVKYRKIRNFKAIQIK